VTDPEVLFNKVSQLTGPKQTTPDPTKGDDFMYMRDSNEQWGYIPTDTTVFKNVDSPFIRDRFFPFYIVVFKNPTSIFMNEGAEVTIPTNFFIDICCTWEFQGMSSVGHLEYPPIGQAAYRTLYAAIVLAYIRSGIGENPKHIRKLVTLASTLAKDPKIQALASLVWSVTKVAAPAALALI